MTSTRARRARRSLPANPSSDAPRHVRKFRAHRAMHGVAMVLVGLFTFVSVGVVSATARLEGNVKSESIDDLLGTARPTKVVNPDDPNAGHALNIVLLGSDYRGNGDVVNDGAEGMRSDTTIVMHISSDRKRIELVSIPRDSYVDIPSCTMTNGNVSNPSKQRFNAAFAIGWNQGRDVASAAACTITTIESLTGVFIDGYAVVDFGGFERMVDALGGVPMCVPNDISAPKADLELKAGFQTLDGKEALGFARARTGVGLGDGSDTNRIGRQQQLMSAIAGEVFKQNLLTDLPELYAFLDAATSSVTAGPSLASVKNLAGLAYSLRSIRTKDIVFLTIPWVPNPLNKNEVVWDANAPQIWENMASDVPLIPEMFDGTDDGTGDADGAAPSSPGNTDAGEPGDGTDEGDQNAPSAPTTPKPTKTPGKGPFTADDTTAQC